MLRNIIIATVTAATMAIELTPENWEAQTAGKTAFVKFYAPWCGHCKAMKPAWDELMEEYASSDAVIIADVDCTGTGKPICDKAGVQGFPTVKFGDPSNLEDYKGGRDADALKKFAENLKPPCNVATLENCEDAQKEVIATLMLNSEEELAGKVTYYETEVGYIEGNFTEFVEEIKTTYNDLIAKKTTAMNELDLESNVGLVKMVQNYKSSKEEL